MSKFDEILRYLNYTKQTFEELWESPDHAIFTYKKNQDGVLILDSLNKTSCVLSHASLGSEGKTLEEVYGKENADARQTFFDKWKELGDPVSYIYEAEKETWVATMQVKGEEMFGIIRKGNPNSSSEAAVKSFSQFDESRVDCDNTISLLLAPDESGFRLVSYNSALIKFTIEPRLIDCDPQTTVDYFINAKMEESMMQCINQNRELKEIVVCDGIGIMDERRYYLVHAIPMLHTDGTGLLLRATNITDEYNEQEPRLPYDNYEPLLSTKMFGVCFFKVNSSSNFDLDRYNDYFKNLVNNNIVGMTDLSDSGIIHDSINMIKASSGFIVKTASDGLKVRYFVYCAPILLNERIDKLLVFVSPEQESMQKYAELKEKLTPRETEILGFVADGFTNRYIAKKLKISEGTVKRTIYNGYKKLDIGSRVELVRIFWNL